MHPVVVIAVFEHPGGCGSRGLDPVRQRADERLTPDQRRVEIIPRTAGQRDAAHPVVIQQQPVREQLQRIGSRINDQLRLRQAAAQRIAEPEEERIARSEDHHLVKAGILFEYRIQRDGDFNPAGAFRQQRRHNLVMALSARKYPARRDGLADLRRKPDLAVVGHPDHDKLLLRHPGRV